MQSEFDKLAKENQLLHRCNINHIILINEFKMQIAEIRKNRDELQLEEMKMIRVIKSHN
jgi:hypothetical protein